jgi:hypothetical protein
MRASLKLPLQPKPPPKNPARMLKTIQCLWIHQKRFQIQAQITPWSHYIWAETMCVSSQAHWSSWCYSYWSQIFDRSLETRAKKANIYRETGVEKAPFSLPNFIDKTRIGLVHDGTKEDEEKMILKQKNWTRVSDKGWMDENFRTMYNAFLSSG